MKHTKIVVAILILVILISLSCSEKEINACWDGSNVDSYVGCLEATIDLHELMGLSSSSGKKILLYFNAIGCLNCRRMENEVLSSPEVQSTISQMFVFRTYYVDSREMLTEKSYEEPLVREGDFKSVGEVNSKIQGILLKSGSQPFFAILDERLRTVDELSLELNVDEFLSFLGK
ncbi:MAG: thioredoxin family protein [Saprospiraceae bacterium]|nr:thioredoxin family protein [Saprospiraceae bacterium]